MRKFVVPLLLTLLLGFINIQAQAETEPNNTFATATLLGDNTEIQCSFTDNTDIDIFKLENADTFLGADILDSLPDYEKDKIITRFNNILEGKSVPTVEEKVYDSKGNLMNLEVISQKVDFQGNSAIMTLFSDITQRKLTEKALKESEESYRRFFDHSPDPIVIIADGKILSYNKAAIDFIEEESTNSYIGLSIDSFLHPDYSRQVHELLKTIDSGIQYDSMMKLVFITKKGNEKFRAMYGLPDTHKKINTRRVWRQFP